MASTETLDRHELSAAWPDMESGAFDELVESIAHNGLRESIVLFEGKVLDGWHRYQACLESGSEPDFVQFGDYEGHGSDAAEFAIDENLHRRHLSKGQRATSLARVVSWREAGHRDGEEGSAGMSNAEMSQKAGVSERVVSRAKQLVSSGDEELIDDVINGEKSLNEAVDVIAPPKTVEVEIDEAPAVDSWENMDDDQMSPEDSAAAAAVAEFEEGDEPDNIVEFPAPPTPVEPAAPKPPSRSELRGKLESEEDMTYALGVQRDQLQAEVERLNGIVTDLRAEGEAQRESMTEQGQTITELRKQAGALIGWREMVVDAVRRLGADTDSDTQGAAWDDLVKLVDSLGTSAAA